MSNKTAAAFVVTMVLATFAGMGLWLTSRRSATGPRADTLQPTPPLVEAKTPPIVEQPKPEPQPAVPAYRVISDIEEDEPYYTSVTIVAHMQGRVAPENVRFLLHHLYRLAKKRGPFRHRKHPSSVYVQLYARKGQVRVGAAGETLYAGYNVFVHDLALEHINDPPIERFGLSEADRQKIWRDYMRAEGRARRKAEARYPWPMSPSDPNYTDTANMARFRKQDDFAAELREEYKIQLAKSLNSTREQLEAIADEGVENWWATPEPPKTDDRDIGYSEAFAFENVSARGDGSTTTVIGEIVNNSGKSYEFATFTMSIYDTTGRLIDTDDIMIGLFPKGQRRPFKLRFDHPFPVGWKYKIDPDSLMPVEP